ncbi:MAG: UvrD-helicase domain-containing protein [Elusimicrobiota bacterium]
MNRHLFEGLNARQQEAALMNEGPLIVVAGPGTGKTHALVRKAAYLIVEQKIQPEQILAVTFTQSAAKEMRQRLGRLLGEGFILNALWVGTFHATALKILRRENYPFGPGVSWSVIEEGKKPALLDGLVASRQRNAFLEKLRRTKEQLAWPSDPIAQEYQRRLLAGRCLDFDDLFLYMERLFDERPKILERYRERWRFIMVDEFQDTSLAQYRFLSRLITGNVCVIGDPDQSIYGFTGEEFRPFEQFQKDHAPCRKIVLSENYRSRPAIVAAASQIIAKNPSPIPRELEARLGSPGLPIEIASYQNERQEAEMTARRIEHLLGGSSHFAIDSEWAKKEEESGDYGLGDIAIFYRFHAQARGIQSALERAGLPLRIFAKKCANVIPDISANEDVEDFRHNEDGLPPGEGITLMTLHRAKGLEFQVVFIIGCEQGIVPWQRAQNSPGINEERRLFYVGVTRAKSRLFLSWAKTRFLFGQTRDAGASPFLSDIEQKLRRFQENRAPAKKRPAPLRQPTLFEL